MTLGLPCDVPNHVSYIQSWVQVSGTTSARFFAQRPTPNPDRRMDPLHHPAHGLGDDDPDTAGDEQPSQPPTEALAA